MHAPTSHDDVPHLAALARMLADETRAVFCLAMLDGRAWTASELARHAGVARSTASEHLSLLVAGGLLREHRQGRHRYVQLVDAETAGLLEALASSAPRAATPVRTLADASRRRSLAFARTCYDHLAGAVGVAVTDAMVALRYLTDDGGLTLTPDGRTWLAALDISLPQGARRPPTRACLDWTERRIHLGGTVGAALCQHSLAAGWVRRLPRSRAVTVTEAGRQALVDHLSLDIDHLAIVTRTP